jgi:hypothetical protein
MLLLELQQSSRIDFLNRLNLTGSLYTASLADSVLVSKLV